MIDTLKNIASVQTGIFVKPTASGDVVYLQAKHFNEFGTLNGELYPDLKETKLTEKHLLRPGDVLFAAKGTKNFAALYEAHNRPTVASTTFMVIRILNNTRSSLLPAFLAWHLNHPTTQAVLKAHAIGTSMVSLSKKVLEELSVPIPDLQTQTIILTVSKLQAREKDLKKRLDNLRETWIQQQLIEAIQS